LVAFSQLTTSGGACKASTQWRSQGRAWPGTCPAKVHCVYVRASTSVVSAMVRCTAGAWPIPMTWLRHCFDLALLHNYTTHSFG